MNERHWNHLIHRHLDDSLTASELLEFESLMLNSGAARRLFWELAEVHSLARESARLAWGQEEAETPPPEVPRTLPLRRLVDETEPLHTFQTRTRPGWLTWRPLTAAAAGIVFGMVCTSVLFAYVAPSFAKVRTLLEDGFESGPPPLVTGVPVEIARWGGDYSEVVGEQQGVRPALGQKMLRFMRGDYEGRDLPSSHSSDVFRLVDLRPYRHEFADGGAIVRLSALFNAIAFPEDETFGATLTLFALDARMVEDWSVKRENALSTESLAFSRSSKVVLDRDPTTWQRVSNELRLPPGTDYLMIRMGMSNDNRSKDKRRDSFAGHFADKVQLLLARLPEISAP